jgi:hypothetical protein
MKRNVGGIDKIVRIIAGVVLLSLIFILKNGESYWLWGLIGIVPLATGIFSWCPLYTILGINSCPRR